MFLFLAMGLLSPVGYAGSETYSGKEMKQVAPPPCPEWYADREFNVGIWGTYVFTGNEWANDRYVEADHAWGGGIDLKYFFHRYFGIGIEGWAVDARRTFEDLRGNEFFLISTTGHENRAIGSVLGTLTLRYPIPCTRFAPYVLQAVAQSSAAARGHAFWSKMAVFLLELNKPIPRRRQSANSVVASKSASRRISAGSMISAGMW